MRRLLIWAAVLLGCIALGAAVVLVTVPPPPAVAGTARPVMQLVPRAQVVGFMRRGFWCTWDSPGLFRCTPAQP